MRYLSERRKVFCREDEIPEKRMGTQWSREEFRMELNSHEPWVILQLDDFDKILPKIGRASCRERV